MALWTPCRAWMELPHRKLSDQAGANRCRTPKWLVSTLGLALIVLATLSLTLYSQCPRSVLTTDRAWIGVGHGQDTAPHNELPSFNEERFITCTIRLGSELEYCDIGGLANEFFRLASLYGIGRRVGRRPYFADEGQDSKGLCMMGFKREIDEIFPGLLPLLHAVEPPPNDTLVVRTTLNCCHYEDIEPALTLSSVVWRKYVRLYGDNFQHYKYFADYQSDVLAMMKFNDTLVESVARSAAGIFGDDSAHKFCVHTRRGDFIALGWESEAAFVNGAIDLVVPMLKYDVRNRAGGWNPHTLANLSNAQRHENVSLVLLGEDRTFLEGLAIDAAAAPHFQKVHLVQLATRGADLCFAATHCDSVLISAPHSTFSWWIAYLAWSRGRGPIFFSTAFRSTGLHDRSNFLPEWIPLKLVNGGDEEGRRRKVVVDELV